jgi:hypothetical protein
MSSCFHEALREIHLAAASADGDAKRSFYTGATARLMHCANTLHHIGTDLHRNLRLIERMLSLPQCPTSCPIAYLIPRVPIGTARTDFSLTAAGGYCPEAKFWWYLEWPKPIQARTLHHVKARNNPSLMSINSLNYAVQLITMVGCHLSHLKTKDSRDAPIPSFSLSVTTPWASHGSQTDARQAPQGRSSPVYRPPSSSTKVSATALATLT